MFVRKKEKPVSLMVQAKQNLSKSPKRNAKKLIQLVDDNLLENSRKGYGYGLIWHQRFGFKVDKEVLDYMKEHYEKQGFEVDVDYPSNVENNKDKTFSIRCD